MAAPSNLEKLDDEWELINDDGFVYKRKKRPCVDLAATSAPPLPDPAVEEKNRRERKKRALLKLKDKYQQEILHWKHWSNTLNAMQQKSLTLQHQNSPQLIDSATSTTSPVPPAQALDSNYRNLVDELLSQAEAQEAIIKHVSNLCDIAEGLCSEREERFKKSFTELPIWGPSPQELMASLYED